MNCHLSEITELIYTSLIKMIILEENFKWHLEAFASELFMYCSFINRQDHCENTDWKTIGSI